MDYSQYKQLEFRRKFLKIFGAEIRMVSPANETQTLGIIKMKAWKLREDVRLFADESLQHEILRIGARQIIDIGATYDVFDSVTNQTLFSLKRQGLKSIFVRDHWYIMDAGGNQIGDVVETSGVLALVRRWLSLFSDIAGLVFAFVPETYDITFGTDGQQTIGGKIVHRKNPFIVKMGLDTSMAQVQVDPRLPISIVSLLSVIDAAKG
ncbi:hypothetical protein H7097_02515 [Aeromicrobium sp.]|nr:hypothetical protein [Candidatus Saccharibacteria bacterium]